MRYVFPVIESQCRYVQLLKCRQLVNVRAAFKEPLNYIKISYLATESESGTRMADNYTKQVVCSPDGAMHIAVQDEVVDAILR